MRLLLVGLLTVAGGYTLQYGDAINAPGAETACGYALEQHVPTFACGRMNWPTGSVAVVFTRHWIQVVRVTSASESNKVLYRVRR